MENGIRISNMEEFIGGMTTHLIGRLCLFMRYGRKSREVVEREYDGSYSVAGSEFALTFVAIILLVLIGSGLCAAIGYLLKSGSGI